MGAAFWELHSEEGEGVCKVHIIVYLFFACISLYRTANGNARVFKSQGRQNKL